MGFSFVYNVESTRMYFRIYHPSTSVSTLCNMPSVGVTSVVCAADWRSTSDTMIVSADGRMVVAVADAAKHPMAKEQKYLYIRFIIVNMGLNNGQKVKVAPNPMTGRDEGPLLVSIRAGATRKDRSGLMSKTDNCASTYASTTDSRYTPMKQNAERSR